MTPIEIAALIPVYTAGACIAAVSAWRDSVARRRPQGFRDNNEFGACFVAAFVVGLVWPLFLVIWMINRARK